MTLSTFWACNYTLLVVVNAVLDVMGGSDVGGGAGDTGTSHINGKVVEHGTSDRPYVSSHTIQFPEPPVTK